VTPGNLEFVQVLVSWAVTLPAVPLIIVLDERRLRGVELERAWPPASRDAAIFALWNLGLHPLCVPMHFLRTRRSIAGLVLAVAWLAVIVVADWGARWSVDHAIEALGL
jgi:hypothetical protein